MSTPSLITKWTKIARESSYSAARIYGLLFLLGVMYSFIARLISGMLDITSWSMYGIYDIVSASAISVAILAFYYFFDNWIADAADDSRSISKLDESQFARLKHELVVIPRWFHLIVGVLAGGFAMQSAVLQYGFSQISLRNLLVLLEWAITAFLTFGFAFRIIRLIVLIVRFYSGPLDINLFNLPQIYELSSVVSRAGMFLLLLWYVNLPLNLNEFVLSSPVALGSALLLALLPFGAFLAPQVILSRRLNRNKSDLTVEVTLQLDKSFAKLRDAVEDEDLEKIDLHRTAIDALISKLRYIESIPTWPWRLGAFRITITAVMLPVIVWLIQQVLDQLLQF